MLKLVKKSLYHIRKNQPEIIPILSGLTMGLGGMMQGEFLETNLTTKTQKDTHIFIAYDECKNIVGWTFMFPGLLKNRKQFRHRVYFFTDPKKRKMGIGSSLMESMIKWAKRNKRELYVFPWDQRSRNFFSKWENNKIIKLYGSESLWEGVDDCKENKVDLYHNKRKQY